MHAARVTNLQDVFCHAAGLLSNGEHVFETEQLSLDMATAVTTLEAHHGGEMATLDVARYSHVSHLLKRKQKRNHVQKTTTKKKTCVYKES